MLSADDLSAPLDVVDGALPAGVFSLESQPLSDTTQPAAMQAKERVYVFMTILFSAATDVVAAGEALNGSVEGF